MANVSGAVAPQAKTGSVKDVTTASFRGDVLSASMRQPVLVDFWAPWCGPCKQLTPVLERIVRKADGKVKLVKMNIDDHPEIAGRLGVRSIPAVIAFQKSQPVDGFMGALPESELIGFIERLVGPIGGAGDLVAEAETLLAAGDPASAAEIYAKILAENPSEFDALAGLAKLYIETGDLESARQFLASAPAGSEKHAGIIAARAALELAEQASAVGDLADLKRKVEADPTDHKLSNESPVGHAIMGHKPGEVIAVAAPRGETRLKIIDIERA